MGASAAEEAAKKIGSDGWEVAKLLWNKLKPAIEANTSSKGALVDALENPDDPDFQAALRIAIRKVVEADQGLCNELAAMLADPKQQAGIIQAHQYVSGNYNATADRGSAANVVIGTAPTH